MYIGVSGYNHESAAALVDKNGELVDYYREESLSRIKGDKSFPRRAIRKLLYSNKKVLNEDIRIAFLIFVMFFASLFLLSGFLILDTIDFKSSFTLSILTLTNTVNSDLYGNAEIDFSNLLTISKIFLIIFMIVAKIELLSFFLIIKKLLFKN